MRSQPTSQNIATGIGISVRDLLHEWKLSCCLLLAIGAVVAPLLLLFGLKYGTIATLRSRLVDDPRNREIVPLSTRNYPKEWFEETAARPDIAFVLPATRQIAATVEMKLAAARAAGRGVQADIVPTGPGDILLGDNGMAVPGEKECVLTRLVAEELGARTGDRLSCMINRSVRGRAESVSFQLEVKGVLPDRAGTRKAVFIPLSLVEAVENYKDGRSVPAYGWPGDIPRVSPRFDGFILIFPAPLAESELLSLPMGTGLSQIKEIRREEAPSFLGFALPHGLHAYLLHVIRTPVSLDYLDAVTEKLRGRGAQICPYTRPARLEIAGGEENAAQREITILGCTTDRTSLSALGREEFAVLGGANQRIILPDIPGLPETGETVRVVFKEGGRDLAFPMRVAGRSKGIEVALVPGALAGILTTAREREVHFDAEQGEFLTGRMSYAGFRMYARTIDDVEPIRRFLVDQGIEVSTRAEDIERVRAMDRGLTRVFWLVAVVGIIGCMAALVASLSSSVERKRRDLSVMRLMGMSGWMIFQVPVSQALFLGTAGFLMATLAFFAVSGVINTTFATDLLAGEKMCFLAAKHFGAALLGTLAVVFGASLFAAWQTTRIDPAEALRDE